MFAEYKWVGGGGGLVWVGFLENNIVLLALCEWQFVL